MAEEEKSGLCLARPHSGCSLPTCTSLPVHFISSASTQYRQSHIYNMLPGEALCTARTSIRKPACWAQNPVLPAMQQPNMFPSLDLSLFICNPGGRRGEQGGNLMIYKIPSSSDSLLNSSLSVKGDFRPPLGLYQPHFPQCPAATPPPFKLNQQRENHSQLLAA